VTKTRRQPQRTCLGCRQVFGQNDLVRFVRAPDGALLVDLRSRLPGRGAYTCWSRDCIDLALRKRQFDRAFRQPCQVSSTDEVVREISAALSAHMLNLLGMGRKAAQMIAGSNAVLTALNSPARFALIILATDISKGIAEKVERKAAQTETVCIDMYTKSELGRISGRAENSVLGLYVGQLAEAFMADLRRYRNISGES
jgi:predicted RNA-binding protein YlxR (DUF448 family)